MIRDLEDINYRHLNVLTGVAGSNKVLVVSTILWKVRGMYGCERKRELVDSLRMVSAVVFLSGACLPIARHLAPKFGSLVVALLYDASSGKILVVENPS